MATKFARFCGRVFEASLLRRRWRLRMGSGHCPGMAIRCSCSSTFRPSLHGMQRCKANFIHGALGTQSQLHRAMQPPTLNPAPSSGSIRSRRQSWQTSPLRAWCPTLQTHWWVPAPWEDQGDAEVRLKKQIAFSSPHGEGQGESVGQVCLEGEPGKEVKN